MFNFVSIVHVENLIACSRLSVSEDNRKSERATSGISRRAGSGRGKERAGPLFCLPDPARRPPLFQSSPLTESLEQAKNIIVINF